MIAISGNSIAGLTASYLLASHGFEIAVSRSRSKQDRVIDINPATAALLADLVGDPALIPDGQFIRSASVFWGKEKPQISSGERLIISQCSLENWLYQMLIQRFGKQIHISDARLQVPEWRLSDQPIGQSKQGTGGLRSVAVQYEYKYEICTTVTESFGSGWFHAMPAPISGIAVQYFVFGEAEVDIADVLEVLERSQAIGDGLGSLKRKSDTVDAFPHFTPDLIAKNSILIGNGAVRMDPICGDGVGFAVRNAILAAAVIRKARARESIDDLMTHYTNRIASSFSSHLKNCIKVYSLLPDHHQKDRYLKRLQRAAKDFAAHANYDDILSYQISGSDLMAIQE